MPNLGKDYIAKSDWHFQVHSGGAFFWETTAITMDVLYIVLVCGVVLFDHFMFRGFYKCVWIGEPLHSP